MSAQPGQSPLNIPEANSVYGRLRKAVPVHGIAILCIAAAAIAVRLVLAGYAPPTAGWADGKAYHTIADNLSAGNGYSMGTAEPYVPTRYRTPAYPAFLALIYLVSGPSAQAAVVVQAFLGGLTVLLAYLLGRRIFDRRTGFLAALIVAFYPAMIYYDTRILREGFTALILMATVLLAVDLKKRRGTTRRLLSVGTLLAVVSMCRPETLLLAVPIGYLLVRPVHRLRALCRPIVLVGLPILLVWVPWTARNYITFESISPVRAGLGSVLWFGSRWAETGGDDQTLAARNALKQKTLSVEKGATEAEVDRLFMKKALRDISERPGWFLHMAYKKLILFWKDANGVKKTLPAVHPFLPPLLNSYYYGLLILAVIGIAAGARSREWVLPLSGVIVIFMMTYVLLHVRNRYRVPVLPLVFVLSAGGFWSLYDFIKSHAGERFKALTDSLKPRPLNQNMLNASPPSRTGEEGGGSRPGGNDGLGGGGGIMTPHAQKVQQRFGAEAQNWSGLYRQSRSIYAHNLQRRRQQALGLLKAEEGRVLEIGCGAGNVLLSLPEGNGLKAIGVDFSLNMLLQARRNANGRRHNLPLLAADACGLPFGDGSFHAVLCLGLLEYIPGYRRVLAECHRILKPGGELIVSIPNIASPFIRIDDLSFGLKNSVTQSLPAGIRSWIKTRLLGRQDRPYFNHRKLRFNPGGFADRLTDTGFRIQETAYHTYGFGLLNGIGLNLRMARHLEARARHSKTLEKLGWTCILRAIKP